MPVEFLAPYIITEAYGIPKAGKYYMDAVSRAFYKCPFAHDRRKYNDLIDYDAVESLYKKLKEIDAYCDTDSFRFQMFGDKMQNKYQYQPLVRTPEEDEEKQYYNPPYTKFKLGLKYNTSYPDFLVFEKKDGLRKMVQLDTFDDVPKYVNYLSKVRLAVSFSKLYATKSSVGNEKRKYGITLKATHIEVQPHITTMRVAIDEYPFIDEEEEEVKEP